MTRKNKIEKENTNVKEVRIVKRTTRMDSDDYTEIHLKSSDESIEDLLKKAILATYTKQITSTDKKLGIY